MVFPPHSVVLLKSKVRDSEMAHRQSSLITLILLSIFISPSDSQAFGGHYSTCNTFIRLAPMAPKSASPLRTFFKETIPESSKSEFSNHAAFFDTGKIYCCTRVTAIFRTALEGYCINYIIPLGALLTLKCLMRLAKDLNKENLSYKGFLLFYSC